MTNWTDDRIEQEVFAITVACGEHSVVPPTEAEKLMQRMRNEMQAEIQKRDDVIRTASREIADMQRAKKNILNGAAKTSVSHEHRYDALLDYTRRLYSAVAGMSVMELWTDELYQVFESAPPEAKANPQ